MQLSPEIVANVDISLASFLLMFGVLFMAAKTLNFKDLRSRYYVNMVVLILIYDVATLISSFIFATHGSVILMKLVSLIVEIALDFVMFFLLLFVMAEIYKSRDYIKRRLPMYSVPIALLVLANITTFFTGWLWDIKEDLTYKIGGLYYVYIIIMYGYIVFAIIQYARFKSREKSSARFNIWLYLIPMVCGTLTEGFTGYCASTLGCALGFTALYMVMSKEMGYRDFESGFYNPVYLSQLYSLVDNGTYNLSSIITYKLSDPAQLPKFSEVLKTVLPDGTDTIRTDECKFITVCESADRGYVFMLTEDVSMVAQEAGIDVQVDSTIKGKKELAADFFIDNIRLRRN